jgi:DNA polymerase/3'-5' exonuclease PolX
LKPVRNRRDRLVGFTLTTAKGVCDDLALRTEPGPGEHLRETAFVTWPLMAGVQMMCARIGMVSGYGLAEAFRKKFPRPLVALAALALLAANTVNIGADLAGMADAAQMLTGINSDLCVVLFGVGISAATVWLRYHQIANVRTARGSEDAGKSLTLFGGVELDQDSARKIRWFRTATTGFFRRVLPRRIADVPFALAAPHSRE